MCEIFNVSKDRNEPLHINQALVGDEQQSRLKIAQLLESHFFLGI